MANKNGTKMTSDVSKYIISSNDTSWIGGKKVIASMSDQLFKNKRNILNMGCMISCFVGYSFCQALVGIQMKYIRGDFYLNNHVGAISEAVAFATSGILIKFFGIK